MEIPDLHLGIIIMNRIRELGISRAELARRMGYSRQGITNILKRDSMQTEVLRKVSNVVGYNFFNAFADEPKAAETVDNSNEMKALHKEVEDSRKEAEGLKKEVAYLKKIVALYERAP